MTFCLGIAVQDGLVALADTQIVKGSERSSKGKLSIHEHRGQSFFLMTSGLRSVRDKAVIYLDEWLALDTTEVNSLHEIATAFGKMLRKVKAEDGDALAESNLKFNLNCILGGRFSADAEPKIFQIYPEGNWIVSQHDAPYLIIGRTHYGRPILDRILTHETPGDIALALAFLAFDATSASVTDVDCPIDVAYLAKDAYVPRVRRYDELELKAVKAAWNDHLRAALSSLPLEWAEDLVRSES